MDETRNMSTMDRRTMLTQAALVTAGVTMVGSGDAQAVGVEKPEKMPPQPGDRLQFIKGELKGKFVRPELLTMGERQIEVFPFDPVEEIIRRKNRLNRALVIRLDPAEMDEATRERSVDGVLAYSAICTHKGCTIKSWKKEERHLRCHCHLSEFAALSEGSVKSGPARGKLAMVPLGLDDEGFVIATDGFTRKPGGKTK